MKNLNTRELIYSALFAALVCVATAFTKIPIPGLTDGYVHVGDTIVFVAALIFPGVQATAVGAIGSAMADILVGATVYALPTFIIKGLSAFAIWFINDRFSKKILSLLAGAFVIVLGYFLFETAFLSIAPAVAGISVLYNLVQVGVSVIVSIFLLPFIKKAIK